MQPLLSAEKHMAITHDCETKLKKQARPHSNRVYLKHRMKDVSDTQRWTVHFNCCAINQLQYNSFKCLYFLLRRPLLVG